MPGINNLVKTTLSLFTISLGWQNFSPFMTNAPNNFNQGKDESFSREPHFGFNEHWDLTTHHNALTAPVAQDISHQVLDALRKRRGLETAQWLNGLTNEVSPDKQALSSRNVLNQNNTITATPDQKSGRRARSLCWIKYLTNLRYTLAD